MTDIKGRESTSLLLSWHPSFVMFIKSNDESFKINGNCSFEATPRCCNGGFIDRYGSKVLEPLEVGLEERVG